MPAAGTGRGKPISCAYTWTEPEPEQQPQLRSPLAPLPPPNHGGPQDPDGRTLRLRGSGLCAAPAPVARAPRTPDEDKGREVRVAAGLGVLRQGVWEVSMSVCARVCE